MINRYSSPQMAAIFSDKGRFGRWRDVELAVLDGYVAIGGLDPSAAAGARAVDAPTPERIVERERTVRHDVVAFLIEWTAAMPDNVAAAVHRGLTSSDVVDTGLALQVRDASELLLRAADTLVTALAEHAWTHRDTIRIGRTHGQHACLDTWGHRVADLALAADRARRQLTDAVAEVAVGKMSGPTGAYHHISPAVETYACSLLGLTPADAATQVIMRDRLASWMFSLARIATVCEAVALEIRLSQRPEVGELFEGADAAGAGSSSMPHKANPVISENICGLATLIRSYVNPILEGAALWHERDLTHSSVERVAVPDAAALTERVVTNTASVVNNLVVDVDRMAATAQQAATASVSNTALVELCDLGLPWAAAHEIVQDASRDSDAGPLAACIAVRLVDRPALQQAWTRRELVPSQPRLETVFESLHGLLEHHAGE